MAEVLFRAKLVRPDGSTPWGFRLQGGVEFNKPLTLLKVVADSLAAKGGLHPGDIVVKLAGRGADCMTHKDAQDTIISAGNLLEIIVERAEATIVQATSIASDPDSAHMTFESVIESAGAPEADVAATRPLPAPSSDSGRDQGAPLQNPTTGSGEDAAGQLALESETSTSAVDTPASIRVEATSSSGSSEMSSSDHALPVHQTLPSTDGKGTSAASNDGTKSDIVTSTGANSSGHQTSSSPASASPPNPPEPTKATLNHAAVPSLTVSEVTTSEAVGSVELTTVAADVEPSPPPPAEGGVKQADSSPDCPVPVGDRNGDIIPADSAPLRPSTNHNQTLPPPSRDAQSQPAATAADIVHEKESNLDLNIPEVSSTLDNSASDSTHGVATTTTDIAPGFAVPQDTVMSPDDPAPASITPEVDPAPSLPATLSNSVPADGQNLPKEVAPTPPGKETAATDAPSNEKPSDTVTTVKKKITLLNKVTEVTETIKVMDVKEIRSDDVTLATTRPPNDDKNACSRTNAEQATLNSTAEEQTYVSQASTTDSFKAINDSVIQINDSSVASNHLSAGSSDSFVGKNDPSIGAAHSSIGTNDSTTGTNDSSNEAKEDVFCIVAKDTLSAVTAHGNGMGISAGDVPNESKENQLPDGTAVLKSPLDVASKLEEARESLSNNSLKAKPSTLGNAASSSGKHHPTKVVNSLPVRTDHNANEEPVLKPAPLVLAAASVTASKAVVKQPSRSASVGSSGKDNEAQPAHPDPTPPLTCNGGIPDPSDTYIKNKGISAPIPTDITCRADPRATVQRAGADRKPAAARDGHLTPSTLKDEGKKAATQERLLPAGGGESSSLDGAPTDKDTLRHLPESNTQPPVPPQSIPQSQSSQSNQSSQSSQTSQSNQSSQSSQSSHSSQSSKPKQSDKTTTPHVDKQKVVSSSSDAVGAPPVSADEQSKKSADVSSPAAKSEPSSQAGKAGTNGSVGKTATKPEPAIMMWPVPEKIQLNPVKPRAAPPPKDQTLAAGKKATSELGDGDCMPSAAAGKTLEAPRQPPGPGPRPGPPGQGQGQPPEVETSPAASVAPWRHPRHQIVLSSRPASATSTAPSTAAMGQQQQHPAAGVMGTVRVQHEAPPEHHFRQSPGVTLHPGQEISVVVTTGSDAGAAGWRPGESATIHSVPYGGLSPEAKLKDYSKTAPWRVPKQQGSPKGSLYPWRKTHDIPSPHTGEGIHIAEEPVDINQSSLTYVGKRIESPTTGAGFPPLPPGRAQSPDLPPPPPYTPPSAATPLSLTSSMLKPTANLGVDLGHSPRTPDDIRFSAVAPDLVDIPMPAVKEMVADLNRRLEAIAAQHPKIVEPTTVQELGLNYFHKTDPDGVNRWHFTHSGLDSSFSGEGGEREIFIDTPPNPELVGPALQEIKQRLFAAQPVAQQPTAQQPPAQHPVHHLPPGTFHYEVLPPEMSPRLHRRRFSLPGGSVTMMRGVPSLPARRVHFAEPVESSVIEIEPRRPRRRERLGGGGNGAPFDHDGSISDVEDYNSVTSLAAKLDKLERENAIASASLRFQKDLSSKDAKPTESFRDKVISFESLGEPTRGEDVLAALSPQARQQLLRASRGGQGGFSFSLGEDRPGSIRLSVTHQAPPGHPSQMGMSVPQGDGQYSYTISSQPGVKEPITIRYAMPASYQQRPVALPPGGLVDHTRAASLGSAAAKTVHIHYPPSEGSPSIQPRLVRTSAAGPLSPPRGLLPPPQYATGNPGALGGGGGGVGPGGGAGVYRARSPVPNYSNTLQIDTSSQYHQPHRSPPALYTGLSPPAPQAGPGRGSPQLMGQQLPLLLVDNGHPVDPAGNRLSPSRVPIDANRMTQGPVRVSPVRLIPRGPSPINRPLDQTGVPYATHPQLGAYVNPISVSPLRLSPQPQPSSASPQQHHPYYGQAPGLPGNISPRATSPTRMPPRQGGASSPIGLRTLPGYTPRAPPPGYGSIPGFPQRLGQPAPRLSPTPSPVPGPGPGQGQGQGQIFQPPPGVPTIQPGTTLPAGLLEAAGISRGDMPPGLFALFDKKFTEKFLQWQSQSDGGLQESETYKLVHEMDDEERWESGHGV